MNLSKLAQDVLAFAGEKGKLAEDWGQLERNLLELLMRVGQAAMQVHADGNTRRGYEGSSRACRCGRDQKFVSHRRRTIEGLFGTLTYTRAYYHCRDCGRSACPFDQAQGLGSRHVSVALAQKAVALAEAMPFRQAVDKLQALLGRKLSANTVNRLSRQAGATADAMEKEAAAQVQKDRHAMAALEAGRLYNYADGAMVHRLDGWHEVKALQSRWQDAKGNWQARHICRNEQVESFAAFAWACMHVCGLENARQSILLGDGIPWIWNHLAPIADQAVQIVDWYHAKSICGSWPKHFMGRAPWHLRRGEKRWKRFYGMRIIRHLSAGLKASMPGCGAWPSGRPSMNSRAIWNVIGRGWITNVTASRG